ncbi:MAG: aldehyde dehydrogenase, partial [Desulfocapsa sp.]
MTKKKCIETISPIDNSVYVQRDYASATDINKALETAETVQKAWKATPLLERKALCSKAIDAFVAQKDAIAEEICWQMGRPIRSAAGEVGGMEERSRAMITLADQGLATIKLDEKQGFERW